jgi:hypothetical protein
VLISAAPGTSMRGGATVGEGVNNGSRFPRGLKPH